MKPDPNNLQGTVAKASVTGPRIYLMDCGNPRGVLSTIEVSRLARAFTPRGK